MRLYLIRHGETVDNVAHIYAGSRDSALTNHGFQQATRLGLYFNESGVKFTHIYSSNLQRAYKTAELVAEGQQEFTADAIATLAPAVTRLSILTEKDFGYMEGQSTASAPQTVNKIGMQVRQPESHASMVARMDVFLDQYLFPLLIKDNPVDELCVGIVSHGMIMPVLWERMLLRLPFMSLTAAPAVLSSGIVSVDRLGGWSNTGYLLLDIQRSTTDKFYPGAEAYREFIFQMPLNSAGVAPKRKRGIHQFTVTIMEVNSVEHLKGLKRTGGGVGSSRHDEAQKTIDTFFRRPAVP